MMLDSFAGSLFRAIAAVEGGAKNTAGGRPVHALRFALRDLRTAGDPNLLVPSPNHALSGS